MESTYHVIAHGKHFFVLYHIVNGLSSSPELLNIEGEGICTPTAKAHPLKVPYGGTPGGVSCFTIAIFFFSRLAACSYPVRFQPVHIAAVAIESITLTFYQVRALCALSGVYGA